MATIRLILHGKAAGRPAVRAAVGKIRAEGIDLQVRVTWEGGDSQRLTDDAIADGVATIIAGGGDGTLNEVASTMAKAASTAQQMPSFGMLPLGTANDFARSCGIPLDAYEALRLVTTSQPRAIDLGRDGDRSFINVATGGVGTEITVETPEELKRLLGGAAYFVTAFKRLGKMEASEITFHGPDFDWSGGVVVLGIGNGRQAGGGNVLCPDAMIDDGLLDVRILPDLGMVDHQEVLKELVTDGLVAIERRIVTAKVPWVELTSANPFQINLDGEPLRKAEFRFEVQSGCVRAHLPKESPLLST